MLRLVYRSYGGENLKNRPPFYSKRLALLSFLRAAEAAGSAAEVLYVNDGPVPWEILHLQRQTGQVIELPRVGMRGSYVFALRMPDLLGWADDDLVWYSEDDYLYRPDAFTHLISAGAVLPSADYFALYGFHSIQVPAAALQPDPEPDGDGAPTPRGWRAETVGTVDGVRWDRIPSTASTFGGRAGALRQDHGIFRFCMIPHKTMYRDHDTCLVLQGFEPHPYPYLARSVVAADGWTPKAWVRNVAMLPFLVATNLRAHRRPGNRRLFVAAVPNLATHLETGRFGPGGDWVAVAEDVARWGAGRYPEAAADPEVTADPVATPARVSPRAVAPS